MDVRLFLPGGARTQQIPHILQSAPFRDRQPRKMKAAPRIRRAGIGDEQLALNVGREVVEIRTRYRPGKVVPKASRRSDSRVSSVGRRQTLYQLALSRLPGRDQLIAMLMSTMKAPIQNMVYVMNGVTQKLARVLQAVADKKAAESN